MSEESDLKDQDFTLDELIGSGWQTAVQDVNSEGYWSWYQTLSAASKLAYEREEHSQGKVLELFAYACSMGLQPESLNEPFSRLPYSLDGKYPSIPESFRETDISFFAMVVDKIDNPWLKSRLAELAWLRQKPRKVNFALVSIASYREILRISEEWTKDRREILLRVLTLARMLGDGAGGCLDEMESEIVERISSTTNRDDYRACRLVDALYTYGLGKNHWPAIASKLENLACEHQEAGNLEIAEGHFCCAAGLFKNYGDEEKSAEIKVAQAETWVARSNEEVKSDTSRYTVAASLLEMSIQVYREIPGKQREANQVNERISELRIRLNKYGLKGQEEMRTIAMPGIDIHQLVEKAREVIRNKTSIKALLALANIHTINYREIRASTIQRLSSRPTMSLFPISVSSHDGRVVAVIQPMKGPTPTEEDEQFVLFHMQSEYGTRVNLIVQGLIIPALNTFALEHYMRKEDFVNIARCSPVVPAGREVLIGRALYEGYNGDFVLALHLLTPQIEHMVRFHLKNAGVPTSTLNADRLEAEKGLSALMESPETIDIFGENLTYEFKALYCLPFGPNLRNYLAHGLLDDMGVQTIDSIYAWWLGLKIVVNRFWNPKQYEGDI